MSKYPCKVMITNDTNWGTVSILLSIWLELGPGLRIGQTIGKVFCEEDGKELSRSVVPFQYRNDHMSKFFVAIGLFEYPWKDSYDAIVKNYGKRFEKVRTILPINLTDNRGQGEATSRYHIGSDLTISIPPNWQGLEIKSLNNGFLIFTNNNDLLKSKYDYKLVSFNDDTEALFYTIVRQADFAIDDYAPDTKYSEEISRGRWEINKHKSLFRVYKIRAKPFAIISAVREIPLLNNDNSTSQRYIHVVGLASSEGYHDPLNLIKASISSIEMV